MTMRHTLASTPCWRWRAAGVSQPDSRGANALLACTTRAGSHRPLALLTCLVVSLFGWTLSAQEPTDASIESGREALTRATPDPPWYDADSDGVGRLHVKAPRDIDFDPGAVASTGVSGLVLLAWVVFALLLIGLAFLLVSAFLKSENNGAVAAAPPQAEVAARVEELPVRVPRGTTDLLGEARRHRDAGNYAEAIIYLYSYQLLELDRQQLIRLARGKTNRQYLSEVSGNDTLRELIEQTMVTFENVFFGNRALDRGEFDVCWSRLDEFHALAQQVNA